MNAVERKKLFEEAKRLRNIEKQQEALGKSSGSTGNRTFATVDYTPLIKGAEKVVRVIGDPLSMRSGGINPKEIAISMIVGDDGKKFQCIFPPKSDNSKWLLYRVIDTVMAYKWNTELNRREYTHQEGHPKIFNQVSKNGRDNAYETGWVPRKAVLLNVIDRGNMQWHKENRKYCVLSKKGTEWNDTIFYDVGVPITVYNKLWDEVVDYSGDYNDYDIVIKKLTQEPFYQVFHGTDDAKKISEASRKICSSEPLTEEEASWEGFDFDKWFPITPYSKIRTKLGNTIKRIDVIFSTNFFEELVELEAKELADKEKNKTPVVDNAPPPPKTEVRTNTDTVSSTPVEEDVDLDIQKETVPTRPATRPVAKEKASNIEWEQLSDGTYNGKKYLGVKKMTKEEKDFVLSVNEDGSFNYSKEKRGGVDVKFYEHPTHSSKFISPDFYTVCPLTGDEF